MRQEVEDGGHKGAEPARHDHETDLADGRVGQKPLDVRSVSAKPSAANSAVVAPTTAMTVNSRLAGASTPKG